MSEERSGSILSVDFGNVHTRAVLIDLVEGVYRLVAIGESRTTTGFPWGDVRLGLSRALEQISQITGRRLTQKNGRILQPEQADRSGVDMFLATASLGRPLRTVLMGLVPEVSVASGLHAVAGTYVQIVETVSLGDARSEEEQLNAVVLSRPDLIFITGGTEDGARASVLGLARVAALAVALRKAQPPAVLYAGNSALVPDIHALFDDKTTLLVAPNVRPSLEAEDVEAAQLKLAMAFNALSAQLGTGFESIGNMSHLGILPTAQSYDLMVDYLARALDGNVLAVDIGSAVSTLAVSVDKRVSTIIRTDLGIGHGARDLLDAAGLEAVQAWLPFNASYDDLLTYALNKTLHPGGVPETLHELYFEYALLRAAVGSLVRGARPAWHSVVADDPDATMPPLKRIIAAGAALTRTGRPGLTAMLLLDAIEPTGVTTLYSDPVGVIPALGALAHLNPAAVVQVLDGNSLERLGVLFSVTGRPRIGRAALHVKITPLKGGTTMTQEVEGGHLWIYPLSADSQVQVEIRAVGRGLSIDGKSSVRLDVTGGTAGLIFDARGRPLPLALKAGERAAQMPLWLSEATGDAIRPVDELWLETLARDAEPPAPKGKRAKPEKAPKPKKQRGGNRKKGTSAEPDNQGEGDEMDELRNLFS